MTAPYNLYGNYRIGEGTTIGAYADIGGVVGRDCKIQCHVSIPPGTIIGDRVFVGPGARIANDKHPSLSQAFTPQGTVIEDDVVIGMGALIGPGLHIGRGAVIGMGAVVVKDVEAGTTVIGNPARPI